MKLESWCVCCTAAAHFWLRKRGRDETSNKNRVETTQKPNWICSTCHRGTIVNVGFTCDHVVVVHIQWWTADGISLETIYWPLAMHWRISHTATTILGRCYQTFKGSCSSDRENVLSTRHIFKLKRHLLSVWRKDFKHRTAGALSALAKSNCIWRLVAQSVDVSQASHSIHPCRRSPPSFGSVKAQQCLCWVAGTKRWH